MAKHVSADTITEITSNPAFRGTQEAESPPPTAEQLIDRLRKELADRVEEAKKAATPGQPLPPGQHPQGPEITVSRALADQQQFEQMLKEVPKGFRLAPVLYVRLDRDEKEKITEEYTYNVRPRFLKFLADQHADELKTLGICDYGINRMRQGLDPTNENGEHYSVNVDHIIERNGSGRWGLTKEHDPDQPYASDKYHPNHFGNFILLPEKIHEFKNDLNDLQHASETPVGKNKWILMMIPERNATFTGFVCPPQEPTHRLAGLDLRHQDDFQKIDHGSFVVNTTLHELQDLKDMRGVKPVVQAQIQQADGHGISVAELAALQAEGKKKGDLRKAFGDATAKLKDVDDHLDNFVKPALRDVNAYMHKLFTDLSAKTETRKQRAAFWTFARFFRSQRVRDLQLDVEALPFAEASDLTRGFRKLARDITKVCDRLDAEAKAQYQKKQTDDVPDFHPGPNTGPRTPLPPQPQVRQDNTPPKVDGVPLPRRQRKGPPPGRRHESGQQEGRPKRTFGRPGHFKKHGNG